MADIRETGTIDDFERPDEEPIQPPWFPVPGRTVAALYGGNFSPILALPSDNILCYYANAVVSGDHCEMWGIKAGSAAIANGWRFGFATVASIARGSYDGYQAVPHNQLGAHIWYLRRIQDGVATQLDAPGVDLGDQWAMMRRNGTNIEVWHSADSVTWFKSTDVADVLFPGPYYPTLGMTGTETGWTEFGAGVLNRTHFYRWTRGRGW